MSEKQVIEMLKNIVEEIDYDIFKEIFVEGYGNIDEQKDTVDSLLVIVKKYIDITD